MFAFDQTDKPLESLSPLQRRLLDALRGEIVAAMERVRPAYDPRPVLAVLDEHGKPHAHHILSDVNGGLHQAQKAQLEIIDAMKFYPSAKGVGFASTAWMRSMDASDRAIPGIRLVADPRRLEVLQIGLCTWDTPATNVLYEVQRSHNKSPELGGCYVMSTISGFVPEFLEKLLDVVKDI